MSTKAELFQAYLDEKELKMFSRQDMKDEMNTAVFRTAFGVDGQDVPAVIVVDDSAFCMVQVHLAANALTDDNRVKMFETMNTWNAGLKPFKFIVDSHNNLVMVCCLLNADGQMDGDKVNAMMNTILDYLTKEYKNVIAALKG